MASKKRAKRTVDRSPKWRVVWLGAFCAALIAGIVASPLTSPRVVRVSGAAKHQQESIRAALRSLGAKPSLLIDTGALQTQLLRLPDLKSASFRSNVFGRDRLALQCRQPVALISDKLAVDEAANVFWMGSRMPPNLHISSNVKDFSTIITISDASPLNRLCRVAKKIKESLPKVVGTLEIDDKERIRLRIEGLVVEFGDTSDLDKKIDILDRALKENPKRAQEGGSIILVDPEDPVQVR
jgi:cell division septal protein FtsQ